MDVAFVNRMLGIRKSGGGIWDYKMAEQLRDRGVSVTFFVAKPLTEDLNEDLSPFDYVPVPTPHLQDIAYGSPLGIGGALADIDSRVFASRVCSKVDTDDFDIIQFNTNREFGRYTDRLSLPTILKLNGPPYSLFRDVVNPFAASSYEMLERFDSIITTGMTTSDILEQTDIDPVEINPGVDTNQFTPTTGAPEQPRFLFVGRFVPAKNLELLIESFESFHEGFPESELVLVGDGPLKSQISKLVRKRGLDNAVQMPGYVDNDKVDTYYNRSTAVVLSSVTENYPIVLLEAISSGVPVIAPDLGAIPRIVDDGENGLLFEPGSQAGLVDAMESLTADENKYKDMAERGRQKALREFDWEQRGEELKQLYEQLLDERT